MSARPRFGPGRVGWCPTEEARYALRLLGEVSSQFTMESNQARNELIAEEDDARSGDGALVVYPRVLRHDELPSDIKSSAVERDERAQRLIIVTASTR